MAQCRCRIAREGFTIWAALVVVFCALLPCHAEDRNDALADYVAAPDESYAWKVRRRGAVGPASYAELTLTSQTWRDIDWKHQLFVVRPSTAADDDRHALLIIAGSSWKDELDQPAAAAALPRAAGMFALLSERMRTPVAILLQVPFQPMFGGKREDQLVAMSFDRYLVTGDAQWPLLLPMVKSAVRAMDAVQDFADEEWSMKLKTFTIAGASKRGWTTWLTGAVDRRVTALVPMVIDMLKIEAQLKHQNDVWGDVSRRIGDYTRLDLPKRLNSDAGRKLQSIVDPIHYRDRLTQPKVILIGTNDHFWPLDALNLYWEDLVGPKYIVYVPNNRHGITDIARLTGSLIAVHRHTVTGRPLPELSWNFTDGDAEVSLRVTSQPLPQRVNSWSASSPTRDFREARWSSQPAKADGKDYVRTLRRPESGWSALFGEAVYAGSVAPFYLSTNVKIVGAQDIDSEVPQALNGE